MSVRIGLLGYSGRMGQLIAAEIAAHGAATLAGGVVRALKPGQMPKDVPLSVDAAEVIKNCDVVIDFTNPDASAQYAALAAQLKKPFMSGTTGLNDAQKKALADAAKTIPVLYASNTSLSLAVTAKLSEMAAKLLAGQDYDTAILDVHHKLKKDSPSGIAKTLGEAVERGSGGKLKPQIAAIRAGHIVGEHDVAFAGNGETLTIKHSVTDRRIFARGAVQAALWLHGKQPGLYGMNDVLGI